VLSLSIPLPYSFHNIIRIKTLQITEAPDNPPAITMSQYYLTQTTTNYSSSCQSHHCNQVKILSYTKQHYLLQHLLITSLKPSHKIITHKALLITAAPVNPPKYTSHSIIIQNTLIFTAAPKSHTTYQIKNINKHNSLQNIAAPVNLPAVHKSQ